MPPPPPAVLVASGPDADLKLVPAATVTAPVDALELRVHSLRDALFDAPTSLARTATSTRAQLDALAEHPAEPYRRASARARDLLVDSAVGVCPRIRSRTRFEDERVVFSFRTQTTRDCQVACPTPFFSYEGDAKRCRCVSTARPNVVPQPGWRTGKTCRKHGFDLGRVEGRTHSDAFRMRLASEAEAGPAEEATR